MDSLLRYMYGLEVPIFQATLSDTLDFAWKVLHGIESLRVAAVKVLSIPDPY